MAAKAAFEGGLESTYQMREEFLKRRDLVYNLVKAIPHVNVRLPKGAFYLLPDISYYLNTTYEDRVIKTSDDLCIFLLEVGHVACVGGDSFGAPNCIRFSYAASQDLLIEGMKRIKNTLSLLKKG